VSEEREPEELRAQVASLTAQLTEEHKMASIGRLLAGIVHEINSPIGSILSNNQVIIRSLELVGKAIAGGDAAALEKAVGAAERRYDELAASLSARRATAAKSLAQRVTKAMQELAMRGGRFDVALEPVSQPASYGRESVVFMIATHPKQAPAPLSRVASGGELSRVALAIQIAASEVGRVPTLVFDEVDTGIGGAVAATVGGMLQTLGLRRQVLCVTHLPQVAAHADHHLQVAKSGDGEQATSTLDTLSRGQRIDELARMTGGSAITPKTRAHAAELYEQHRRK